MSIVKGYSMRLILIVAHTELQLAFYLECYTLNLQGLKEDEIWTTGFQYEL